MILDAATKSIEIKLAGAVGANQLPIVAAWADITATTFTPGSTDTQTNGATAVTAVAGPAASTQRVVKSLTVYNADTAAAVVTVQLNNASTLRIMFKATLAIGDTLSWTDDGGWVVLDSAGNARSTITVGYQQRGAPVLITAASGTYTTPTGVRMLLIEAIGGGGGGGGASFSSPNGGQGAGGASGGYALKTVTAPAASYAYVCGALGSAGASSGGTGGTGGDTTIAGITSKGGLGGVGMAASATLQGIAGGAGVVPTGGDMNAPGDPGQAGVHVTITGGNGGGGGSGMYGAGGASRTTNGAGVNGAGYGAGGGGASAVSASAAGGTGAAGCILITEFV